MVENLFDSELRQVESRFDPESLRHEGPVVDLAGAFERASQIVRLDDLRTIILKYSRVSGGAQRTFK